MKGTEGVGTQSQGKAKDGVGDDGTVVAPVAEVRQETSAVKLVRLRVPTKRIEGGDFTFRPGQWVDFYAPGVDKPGGVLDRVVALHARSRRNLRRRREAVQDQRHVALDPRPSQGGRRGAGECRG